MPRKFTQLTKNPRNKYFRSEVKSAVKRIQANTRGDKKAFAKQRSAFAKRAMVARKATTIAQSLYP